MKTREFLIMVALAFFLISIVLIGGCAALPKAKNLKYVSIGMGKNEVVQKIGEPRVCRGSMVNKSGQIIEVWEYSLELASQDSAGETIGKFCATVCTFGIAAMDFAAPQKNYWLYFIDDKLVQWGEAGDWNVERDRIYRIEFNTSPQL